MRLRRQTPDNYTPAFLDATGLARYLSCGESLARRIGTEAGARHKIGRRVLFDREAVDAFVRAVADDGTSDDSENNESND